MKVKKAGMKAPELASEAEALRKDPLKNYSEASTEDG
jgi:spindle assembly checkpoint component MAD3